MAPRTYPPIDRLRRHIQKDPATKCWNWTAYVTPQGYGTFRMPRGTVHAHRAAYELLIGPIPAGLHIDHRCRNRACVNPAHLEPVTPLINSSRGRAARRTYCVNGHEMAGDNTGARSDGKRYCKICHAKRERDRNAAKSAAKRQARLDRWNGKTELISNVRDAS